MTKIIIQKSRGGLRETHTNASRYRIIAVFVAIMFCVLMVGAVSAEDVHVSTFDGLKSALADYDNSSTVILDNDITDSSGANITLDDAANQHTLNLNSHSITINAFTDSAKADAFIRISNDANLTIIGNGVISTKGMAIVVDNGTLNVQSGTITRNSITSCDNYTYTIQILGSSSDVNDYSVVTIGEDATVEGYHYAVQIQQKSNLANGVVLNVYGTLKGNESVSSTLDGYGSVGLTVNGQVNKITDYSPIITIYDGAEIIGYHGTNTSSSKDNDAPAIYAAGYANWIINGGTFTGDEALGVKSGNWTINNGTFIANGEYANPVNAYTNGAELTGAAISITNTYANFYNSVSPVKIIVKNGIFSSKNQSAFFETKSKGSESVISALKSVKVNGGTFNTSNSTLPVFYVQNNPSSYDVSGATVNVISFTQLKAALEAGCNVVMMNDISSNDDRIEIPAANKSTLNLNGYNLTGSMDKSFIVVGDANPNNGAELAVTGPGVIKSNNNYGFFVKFNSSLTLDNVTVESKYSAIAGNANNEDWSNPSFTVINSSLTSTEGAAIFIPANRSVLTISGNSVITGLSGIDLCSGTVTISDAAKIIGTGADKTNIGTTNPADGFVSDGSAISLFKRNSQYPGDIILTIKDNATISSLNSSAIRNYVRSTDSGEVTVVINDSAKIIGNSSVIAIQNYTDDSAEKKGTFNINGGLYNYTSASGEIFQNVTPKYSSQFNAMSSSRNNDGFYYPVKSEVAKIGDVTYPTLKDAVDAVTDGQTIELLNNSIGGGVKVQSDKNFTLDLKGFTYKIVDPTVGSAGTETNGFQLLKNSNITIKDGNITSDKAKILIQNYADLTLDNVTLDGSSLPNLNKHVYTSSNNNGNVIYKGNTTIIARSENGTAFDSCNFSSYLGVTVTIEDNVFINGSFESTIESKPDGTSPEKGKIIIKGGKFTQDPTDYLASGYVAVLKDDIYYVGQGYSINVESSIPGGNITANLTYAQEGQFVNLTNTSDEGYRFIDYNVTKKTNGEKITVTDNEFQMPADSVNVSAIFSKEYNVTNTTVNGGSVQSNVSKAVKDEIVGLSNIPAAGYTFAHYNVTNATGVDIEITGNTFVMPAENVNVSASFTQNTYTITNKTVVGGSVWTNVTTAAEGAAVELFNASNEGYTFSHYNVTNATGVDIEITGNTFVMPAENVNVSASFTQNTYTITNKTVVGGSVWTNVTTAAEGAAVVLFNSTNSGYTFVCYNVTNSTGAEIQVNGDMFVMPAENVNVSASFTQNTYTITNKTVVGGSVWTNVTTAAEGAAVELFNASNEGYTFSHYNVTNATGVDIEITGNTFVMPAENVNVSASFTQNTYSITNKTVVGGSVWTNVTTAAEGAAVELFNASNEGYTFSHYNVTNATGVDIEITGNTFVMPAENVNVSASFTQNTYTITNKTVVGGSVWTNVTTAAEGAAVVLFNSTNSGYTFVCYNVTNSTGAEIQVNGDMFVMPAENVNVSASFTQNTYTITNKTVVGGSVWTNVTTAAEGAAVELFNASNEGYTFSHYNVTNATGVDIEITGNTFVMPAENVNVSASFTQNTYTITNKTVVGGSVWTNVTTAAEGAAVELYNVSDSDYTFSHYNVTNATGVDIEITGNTFVMPAENVNVSASFTQNTYTITNKTVTGGSVWTNVKTAFAGTTVELYNVSDSDYTFSHYNVTNAANEEITVTGNTFVMPAENVNVSGVFIPNRTYTITASAGANGTISPTGEVTVKEGKNQTFTFTANENSRIADIIVDGTLAGTNLSNYTFTNVIADHTISVSFNTTHRVFVYTEGNGRLLAEPVDPFAGDTVNLINLPDPGWDFSKYNVTTKGGVQITVTGGSFTMPEDDVNVTAVFTRNAYSITVNQPAQGGTINANATSASEGNAVLLSNTPSAGYVFDRYNVTNSTGTEIDVDNSGIFIMPADDVTVNATFKAGKYTITNTTSTGGKVWANVTEASAGAAVELSNSTNPGYTFVRYNVTKESGGEIQVTGGIFTMPTENVTVSGVFDVIETSINITEPSENVKYIFINTNQTFTAEGTGVNASTYMWNFGDGATASGITAEHAYSTAGTYTVTVSAVSNAAGETITASRSLEVRYETSVPTSVTIGVSASTLRIGSPDNMYPSGVANASVYDQYGNEMKLEKVTWSSDNTSVVQITQSGYYTSIGVGTANISAVSVTNSTVKASEEITVDKAQPQVSKVIIVPGSVALTAGDTFKFTAYVFDQFGAVDTNTPVTWSKEGNNGTIANDGVFRALSAGTATVKAAAGSVNATAEVTIEALTPSSVIITVPTDITAGSSGKFSAVVLDKYGGVMNTPVTWSTDSGNLDILNESTGAFYAKSAGPAIVNVEAGNVRGSLTISINEPVSTIDILKLIPTSFSVAENGHYTCVAIAISNTAGALTDASYTWTSLNETAVTVSPISGMLSTAEGHAAGNAEISVNAVKGVSQKSGTISVTVSGGGA